MMWGWGNGMGGAGGVIGMVVMLAVLALIVVGIVLLVRGLTGRHYYSEAGRSQEAPPVGTASKGALQVLEDRYARGDVDREEFLRRKADLQS